MAPLGKILIAVGLVITAAGVVLMFSDKIPFIGRLPGDISVKKDHLHIYIPLTTSILLSVAVSLILWLLSFLHRK